MFNSLINYLTKTNNKDNFVTKLMRQDNKHYAKLQNKKYDKPPDALHCIK